jgi:ABC-type nitrate/sulfonate/bicarbonate transport system permease component
MRGRTQFLSLGFAALLLATVIGMWEISVCTPPIPGRGNSTQLTQQCDGRAYALISKPSEIWHEFSDGEVDLVQLRNYTMVTAYNSALALLIVVISTSSWYWFATRFDWARSAGYGFVWFFQVVPYIAFAWIFSIFFGDYDKAIFGFIVAVFPVMGSLLTGLRNIKASDREVLIMLGASHGIMMRHLYIPRGLAYFFGGLALAAPLAVVGAMIADLSGGASAGLGKEIFLAARNSRPAELWIYTGAAIAVSLLFSVFVWLLEASFAKKNRWYAKEDVNVGF